VVEDEALIALALGADLMALGCTVIGHVVSGEDAVARAGRERPDFLVLDVHLAGRMDGIEAAARIQAATGAEIVFLTAYSDGPDRPRMEALEPVAILGKPYEPERLAAIVAAARLRATLARDRAPAGRAPARLAASAG
jgi:CheY-like chemotaxis protein